MDRSLAPGVPESVRPVHTPLIPTAWGELLSSYPDQRLVQFFLRGITEGFQIGYSDRISQGLRSSRKNLEGAIQHPEVVDEYLDKEMTLSRVAGPFTKAHLPGIQISRFGVIPKSHQKDKWRLIVDPSHPKSHSVNDGIPKSLCGLSYITVDDAINKILELGPNTLMAKIDIKSAFRLLPVHPADRHLLAMEWRNKIFIDTCLPFGLRSAPKLFNILADLLSWISMTKGVSFSIHYLDDFLTMGPAGSSVCQQNLDIFIQTCNELGIPLAEEKLEGPSTSLTFLGVVIDTSKSEIRLPEEKLHRIRQEIASWLGRNKATKREILSLVGLLQHATKVIRPGRSFVSRMYATAARVKELDYYTRLGREFKSDLAWWHTFLVSWNGLSLLRSVSRSTPADFVIQTDASGTWGCGAFFNKSWFQWQWPSNWASVSIMAKELVPILLSCIVWGPVLAKYRALFQCDNLSLVAAICKGSSKDKVVMHLLRCLWFFIAYFDTDLSVEHIPGTVNCTADQLSRNQMQSFFLLHPQVSPLPVPLPPHLLQLVAVQDLDWTSTGFSRIFRDIINWVQPPPLGGPTTLASATT